MHIYVYIYVFIYVYICIYICVFIYTGISSSASKEELAKAFLHGMHFFCPKPVETVMLASILNMRKKASSLEAALHDISKQASRSSNAGMINNSPNPKDSFNSAESTKSIRGKSSQNTSPSDLNLMHSGDYGEVAVTKGTGRWKFFNSLSGIFSPKDVLNS
jgi:hypothetical protein